MKQIGLLNDGCSGNTTRSDFKRPTGAAPRAAEEATTAASCGKSRSTAVCHRPSPRRENDASTWSSLDLTPPRSLHLRNYAKRLRANGADRICRRRGAAAGADNKPDDDVPLLAAAAADCLTS